MKWPRPGRPPLASSRDASVISFTRSSSSSEMGISGKVLDQPAKLRSSTGAWLGSAPLVPRPGTPPAPGSAVGAFCGPAPGAGVRTAAPLLLEAAAPPPPLLTPAPPPLLLLAAAVPTGGGGGMTTRPTWSRSPGGGGGGSLTRPPARAAASNAPW